MTALLKKVIGVLKDDNIKDGLQIPNALENELTKGEMKELRGLTLSDILSAVTIGDVLDLVQEEANAD